MKNIITTIKSRLPAFTFDFEKAEAKLLKELEKYDVIVTVDTVKDCKKMATELNKQATEIETKRKEAVAQVSQPIQDFENGMKRLSEMCKAGRMKIVNQVTTFEERTKTLIRQLLNERLVECWDAFDVAAEFRNASIGDMVILTNMTAKEKLTAKAINEVESRVRNDLQQQTKIEARLMKLENACYKAGLKTPLQREHVESFLFDDDSVYDQRLSAMIHVEIRRQNEAEEIIRQQVKKEPPKPVDETEVTTTENIEPDYVPTTQEVTQPEQECVKSEEGRVVWSATIKLKVETADTVIAERVEARLKKVLADVGIFPETIQVNKS